jgi:hypothetical protein
MRRFVMGVAAGLLLCPLTIASSSTTCAETKIRERSRLTPSPLWTSVGLITVEKGAGKPRGQGEYAEIPVKVTSVTWTGDPLPATLWVDSDAINPGASSNRWIPIERMTPGTRWFVIVRIPDGRLRLALAVSGNTVLIPAKTHAKDDVDGCDPRVVNLDALRRTAQRR